ncbi:MAG: hypothetical protein BWY15_00458 [Firmicutes bacterium ADurb.Bin193]|nr:MAG: hypothetical protein BWY15_00458 [Firmicutes bacterium ADurb.Bin193]
MKGKKFDAAEKHFEKKRVAMQRAIDIHRAASAEITRENRALKAELYTLQAENQQLKDHIERLLEYTELTEADIKKACEKDKAMVDMLKMFNCFGKIYGLKGDKGI